MTFSRLWRQQSHTLKRKYLLQPGLRSFGRLNFQDIRNSPVSLFYTRHRMVSERKATYSTKACVYWLKHRYRILTILEPFPNRDNNERLLQNYLLLNGPIAPEITQSLVCLKFLLQHCGYAYADPGYEQSSLFLDRAYSHHPRPTQRKGRDVPKPAFNL